jgi:hypothetical protein
MEDLKKGEVPLSEQPVSPKEQLEPKQELVVVSDTGGAVNFFGSKEGFELAQRVAKVFSTSDLLPKEYKNNIGNCVIALDMAQRMGANPLMVMQNLSIIMGRPCWSSQFLIATLNQSGKFSPLRFEDSTEKGGSTRAWAVEKSTNEKLFGVWVSMDMAKAEGWESKTGSKWKTMPELMRRYRAASFFTKQFAPELSMGFQTVEEVVDIQPNYDAEPDWSYLALLLDMKKGSMTKERLDGANRIIANKEKVNYKRLQDELIAL